MRRLARAVFTSAVAATMLVGPASPAGAADHGVSAYDDYFSPRSVVAMMGDSVTWTNVGQHDHRPLSNQSFFASYLLDPGDVSAITMKTAGTYPYHCQFHDGMTGTIRVPMNKSGAPSSGWKITWSVWVPTPAGRTYDVQVRKPGSTQFEAFRTNTTSQTANFNPSRNGVYAFRARTDNLTFHLSSNWSPVLTLSIS